MTYFVWQADPHGDNYCTLEKIQNLEQSYRLSEGVSYADSFPEEAYFPMDPAYPKDIKLADNIRSRGGIVVVSKRLKAFLEDQRPPHVEFLPVSIRNHKDRVASSEYFIVNPYEVVDCIDTEASTITWGSIDPDNIIHCPTLVLSETAINDRLLLFRPRYKTSTVLVKGDLVEALRDESFTGLHFVSVDDVIL
jgi:hypothetical protein